MILELGDGREMRLPDEMEDEQARQLKHFILACEERAAKAESQVRVLRDEMAEMRKQFAAAKNETGAGMVEALQRLERAVLADRVMVMDDLGEYTRSRVAR